MLNISHFLDLINCKHAEMLSATAAGSDSLVTCRKRQHMLIVKKKRTEGSSIAQMKDRDKITNL